MSGHLFTTNHDGRITKDADALPFSKHRLGQRTFLLIRKDTLIDPSLPA